MNANLKSTARNFTGNQLITDYESLAKSTFKQAVDAANSNNSLRALELGREAMIYANIETMALRSNIHRFMAFLNLSLGCYNTAKIHCFEAIRTLSKKNLKLYVSEKAYLLDLMNQIETTDKQAL